MARTFGLSTFMLIWIRIGALIGFIVTATATASTGDSTATSTPNCYNVNMFTFWTLHADPRQLSVTAECKDAPYVLKNINYPSIQLADSDSPTVHISVVACGDRLTETLVMIKSAIILSYSQLHFHIFADDELRPKFREKLEEFPSFVHQRVKASIYPITYPEGENAEDWKKVFKPCATQRLFIPYILPSNTTDALIYVDTDILFMRPVEDLWNFFNRFNSSHIAALTPEHEWDNQGWYNRFARHPYYGPRGVNSGVMLMNITRMQDAKWIEYIIPYYKKYRFNITWGDQDLINIFFHYFPDKLYVYPCNWNFRPDHCMYGLNCIQAKDRGVSIVHGNRGVYHNEKQPVFKAIYNSIKEYKFGTDLQTGLYEVMKRNIDAVKTSGYCGAAGDVFTLQLHRQIKLNTEMSKNHGDKYEPGDFSLEINSSSTANNNNSGAEPVVSNEENVAHKKQNASQSNKIDTSSNIGIKPKESTTTKANIDKKEFALSGVLQENLIKGLQKHFPVMKDSLLHILREHFGWVDNAHFHHLTYSAVAQEDIADNFIPLSVHEDILGYLSQTFTEMEQPDGYLQVLKALIENVKLLQSATAKTVSVEADSKTAEIQLAVVACGDRLEEPVVMMKSAILLSKKHLHFHVFAESHLQEQFKNKLHAWPQRLQNRFTLHIHNINYPIANPEDWKKLFKKCATQRLFLPDLLENVDSLIYVDTDILFLRPIDDLWARISEFNATHISGLAPEHEDAHVSWYKRFARHPYVPPLGVNSGVMLMNLTRMRQAKWLDDIVPYFHKYRYNITWGDQDLINIYFHYRPEKLYIFPCDWNYRQDHCMYMHVCKQAESNGVSILHGARGVYHNEKELSFRGVYEAIRDYEFDSDMETTLLNSLRANVNRASHTNCGKVGWVLSKQYEQQIKLLKKNV